MSRFRASLVKGFSLASMKPSVISLLSLRGRHLIVSAVVVMLGGFANSTLHGESESLVGAPITVPLTVKTHVDGSPDSNWVDSASRGAQGLREKPANRIKSEPKLHNPKYYILPIEGREILAILDVGKDAEKAELYIDFDGKGLFDTAKGIESGDTNKRATPPSPYAEFQFGPITLPKTAEAVAGPVEVMISCYVEKGIVNNKSYMPYLRVTPHKFVVGKLDVGFGERTVAFVDETFKGKFETFNSGSSDKPENPFSNGATIMGIDLDRNGFLDWSGEIYPLVDLVRIDGKYYRVTIAPDGTQATFQEAKPELSVFDTKCPGMAVFVVSDKCAAMLTANDDGKWELPVGKYAAQSFVLTRNEGSVKWRLDGGQPSPAMQAIEVKSGTPTVLELGPPLLLKYSVGKRRSSDGSVDIGLNVTGKCGEIYSGGASKEQGMEPKPRFTIKSETGENLAEGAFEYG